MAKEASSRFGTPAWLLVFFSNIFFGCVGFSIVLPTVWPYLREMGSSPFFLACVVSMYSVGEGAGGIVSGRIYSRYPGGTKFLLLVSMGLGLTSAFAYMVARLFGELGGPLVVLAARFGSGFDNGARQTIQQTYIGTVVPPKHQSTVFPRLGAFAVIGIMLGPAFGSPLQAMHFEVLGLSVDGNNGPGVLLFAVCLASLVTTAAFFRPSDCSVASAGEGPAKAVTAGAPPPSRTGLYACYITFMLVNLSMASLETSTPIVAQRLYGWGPCLHPAACEFDAKQTYVDGLLTTGGLLSLTMMIIMACGLGRWTYGREVITMSFGLGVYALTNLANVDFGGWLPAWRFVFDYLLGAFFEGLMRGPCAALLSRVIGPHSKAKYMGIQFAWGALPRVAGPFVFVALLQWPRPMGAVDFPNVYAGPRPRTWMLYGSQAVLFAAAVLGLVRARAPIRRHLAALEACAAGAPKDLEANAAGMARDDDPPPETPSTAANSEPLYPPV